MLTVFQQSVQKYLADILKNKYGKNVKAIDRAVATIFTKDDAEQFMNLASELYKSGFEKATESYKEQLTKLGYEIIIKHQND